jgi:alpha-D-ribose 1-methylphosphonate 5-triphosphate diphosphatase PhnM
MAQESGKPIAAVNLGRTRADHLLSLKIEESSERILPHVQELLNQTGA